jgi:hypothetical protein
MTGAREERLKKGGREQIKRRKKKEKKKGEGRTGRTYHDHPPLHGRSLSLSLARPAWRATRRPPPNNIH